MTERGTSTALSYVLTLSIATLLVSGLLFAGSTFVEDSREQVIRQELQVIGEHLASNVEQVERYANATDIVRSASIEQTFPSRVTGSTYDVTLSGGGGDPRLYLNATKPAVSVRIDLDSSSRIRNNADAYADGGTIAIRCEGGGSDDCGGIVIENV